MSEWIDVEHKLPPQGISVLVAKFDHRPKVQMYFIQIASRYRNSWHDENDESEITQNGKYGRVTHWMPLPDAPNKL